MAQEAGIPIEERIERMLARYRGSARFASRQEVEDLYTEGCAEALRVEAQCLRTERRLADTVTGDRHRGVSAETRALKRELKERRSRLDSVRLQVRHLRAAVDWAEEEHDLDELLRPHPAQRAAERD